MALKSRRRPPPRPRSLKNGRPPLIRKPSEAQSSKATRTLIRSHHQLNKSLAKATANNDITSMAAIQAQIESQGGLEAYQAASMTGQRRERGGDTSKVLVEWFAPVIRSTGKSGENGESPVKLLEIGALRTDNACSRSALFEVTRIDLRSQTAGIAQQDFNERPLPQTEDEKFDVISLSLVLNYVPDASGRGSMLKRTCAFLRNVDCPPDHPFNAVLPSLFLVLPAPCVTNSRYLDEAKLTEIMGSLGYVMTKKKISQKLVYYLWRHNRVTAAVTEAEKEMVLKKEEIAPGGKRNNFAITL